jgi:hypothetical protein
MSWVSNRLRDLDNRRFHQFPVGHVSLFHHFIQKLNEMKEEEAGWSTRRSQWTPDFHGTSFWAHAFCIHFTAQKRRAGKSGPHTTRNPDHKRQTLTTSGKCYVNGLAFIVWRSWGSSLSSLRSSGDHMYFLSLFLHFGFSLFVCLFLGWAVFILISTLIRIETKRCENPN